MPDRNPCARATLLVSRHPGAVAWLRAEAARRSWVPARVVSHLGEADVQTGCRVAGTVPLLLMARLLEAGIEVWHLHLPQAGLGERGREHTAAAMAARGARLVHVLAVELGEGGK